MEESLNDKYSIKNLLFYRAIPLYKVADPCGHKLYSCIDCGDKFVLESSFNYHINRKSVKITYKCRHCNNGDLQKKVFYNRCNLLSHIRSHSFKTATINVTDLKIEPLPLSFFNIEDVSTRSDNPILINTPARAVPPVQQQDQPSAVSNNNACHECKSNIYLSGISYKDRARHYARYSNEVFSCPICLLSLPTNCALQAHLRIHLKIPPYYCPECGVYLSNKNITYPFNHNCEGFNMMRATVRLKCQKANCNIFHPNDFKEHMKNSHLKKVFKCPFCVVACFNEETISKHLTKHERSTKPLIFYQCELCPGRLVLQNHIDQHLGSHVGIDVYPCWICGVLLNEIANLIDHHIAKHINDGNLKNMFVSLSKVVSKNVTPKIYRVVKRCDQCLRSFTYKCHYDEINILPNACPYKCTSKSQAIKNSNDKSKPRIVCPLCKNIVDQRWEEIKKHYAEHHKDHRCLDATISLQKVNVKEYSTRAKQQNLSKKPLKKYITKKSKRRNHLKGRKLKNMLQKAVKTKESKLCCSKCQHKCSDKETFESHLKCHRDPCMAYQCMDCGQSFVVKPSFATHLLIEHGITDVEKYISNKNCYNENTLDDQQQGEIEDIEENQCKICKDKFDNAEELEKHFRVHGMAFLLKNSTSKAIAF